MTTLARFLASEEVEGRSGDGHGMAAADFATACEGLAGLGVPERQYWPTGWMTLSFTRPRARPFWPDVERLAQEGSLRILEGGAQGRGVARAPIVTTLEVGAHILEASIDDPTDEGTRTTLRPAGGGRLPGPRHTFGGAERGLAKHAVGHGTFVLGGVRRIEEVAVALEAMAVVAGVGGYVLEPAHGREPASWTPLEDEGRAPSGGRRPQGALEAATLAHAVAVLIPFEGSRTRDRIVVEAPASATLRAIASGAARDVLRAWLVASGAAATLVAMA